ncbi:MAG: NAD(P)/FAD-dependent oxidoreductase [Gammaproteobacteria bacterium]|nr:MAG: NAD(P)/FAD-dependent oxidoreductase [Gammaproteobacteria bacterium]
MTALNRNPVAADNHREIAPEVETLVVHSRVIVIGAGPVGIRFADELLSRRPEDQVHLFGDENCHPYNRIQLSALLAGEIQRDAIDLPLPDIARHRNFRFTPAAISDIDREAKVVTDVEGQRYSYDKLVFATGARAHIPNIPGIERQGVFSFRSLRDTESLYARILRSRHIVVVGGGLLGLEAAKGLLRFHTKVTVVQQGPHLMNRQLDDVAAAILEQEVRDLGINIITNAGVRAVEGFEHVTSVVTRDGESIPCDTVLFCAGITPNIELARNARLSVGRGIVVDDHLQTSDPDIYAIGECCEHQGTTYGLVNPGYEQASVAASLLADSEQQSPHYLGSATVSNLKVVGTPVCSLGEVNDLAARPFQKEVAYLDKERGHYRKLVTLKGRLIGAVGIGEWPESRRIQEAYQNQRKLSRWQLYQFRRNGNLWGDKGNDVASWPDSTVICQCNNISLGQINQSMATGCASVSELQTCSKAGTVCGSCKPLLQQIVGDNSAPEKESGAGTLTSLGILALALVALISFWPEAKVADSVQQQGWFEGVWNDKFWKQVTGFTLLGLTAMGLLMSLRKRLSWAWMGKFSAWRLLHILLGVACCVTLVLHSGFHLGANLNQLLMVNFLAVVLLGAVTSSAIGVGHKLHGNNASSSRKWLQWLHILVSWPLPILLTVHIISVYYF